MRRLVGIAVATAVLVVLAVGPAGCGASAEHAEVARAAAPQAAALGWEERFPSTGPGLVFRVRSLALTGAGWEAEIGIENRTGVAWELPADDPATQGTFGLMLFADDDLARLSQLSESGDLPTRRPARTFAPRLPAVLGPGETWSGTIAAPGALPAGRFVRVVFGPLDAADDPPQEMPDTIVWITDHAHRLR